MQEQPLSSRYPPAYLEGLRRDLSSGPCAGIPTRSLFICLSMMFNSRYNGPEWHFNGPHGSFPLVGRFQYLQDHRTIKNFAGSKTSGSSGNRKKETDCVSLPTREDCPRWSCPGPSSCCSGASRLPSGGPSLPRSPRSMPCRTGGSRAGHHGWRRS
jgi:hypothetical protein